MAHFTGSAVTAFWGSTELLAVELMGHGRTIDLNETAPAPDTVDVTHKADTSTQLLTGLAGAPETNVTMTMLVEDTWILVDTMPLNTQSTLYIYPRGRVAAYPMIQVTPARLHERSYKEAFDGTIEMTLVFNSKVTCLHTLTSAGV